MNDHTKDAGVERIARLEKLAGRLDLAALRTVNSGRGIEAAGGIAANHDEIAASLREDAADLRAVLADNISQSARIAELEGENRQLHDSMRSSAWSRQETARMATAPSSTSSAP